MYDLKYVLIISFIRLGGRYLVLISMHAYFNTLLSGHRVWLPILPISHYLSNFTLTAGNSKKNYYS